MDHNYYITGTYSQFYVSIYDLKLMFPCKAAISQILVLLYMMYRLYKSCNAHKNGVCDVQYYITEPFILLFQAITFIK